MEGGILLAELGKRRRQSNTSGIQELLGGRIQLPPRLFRDNLSSHVKLLVIAE
jgi:hypothetical protein